MSSQEIYVDDYTATMLSKQVCKRCFNCRADHDWVDGGSGKLACPQTKGERKRNKPRDPQAIFTTDDVFVEADQFRF